jgi:hypothetical protein
LIFQDTNHHVLAKCKLPGKFLIYPVIPVN